MEQFPPKPEEKIEKFPSREGIESAFENIVKGKFYTELIIKEDAEGVHLYEIEVVEENGDKVEYNYQRAGYDYTDESLPTNAQFSASIHATFYDSDGMPISGECVANYRDGQWIYV